MLTHGSLFSGIGGFDLAAEWAGWENIFHCEINPFGQKVLKYYWPNSISYHDITKTDFSIHRGTIDVLTGGFPCQPYSAAGKRLGKEDERHLWPEMLRAIREIQPRWIVGENVLGLTNWSGGLVFEEVQTDLEAEGYEVQAYVLPACGVNAPHRRDRVWFVAHSMHNRNEQRSESNGQFKNGIEFKKPEGWTQYSEQFNEHGNNGTITDTTGDRRNRTGQGIKIEKGLQQRPESAGKLAGRFERLCFQGNATNTECEGLQKPKPGEQFEQLLDAERNNPQNDTSNAFGEGLQGHELDGTFNQGKEREQTFRPVAEFSESCDVANTDAARKWRNEWKGKSEGNIWEQFPTESPLCGRNDGLSARLDGITISKHRNESIKAYGNAIVPQVLFQIFKSINQYE